MKRYLDILKKHYEKIILSVVLLGLAGAVGYLPIKIANDRAELRELSEKILNRPVKEMPPLDTTVIDKALAETKERFEVTLSAPPHNTVNPVEWHRERPGAPLQRSSKNPIGASRVEVTKLTPLYITVNWETTGEGGSNYLVRLEDQTPLRRLNKSDILNPGKKLGPVTLKEARVGANGTPELVFALTDSGETFTVVQGTPYRKIGAYMADLKYDLENLKWRDQRVGATLRFAANEFTISSINAVAPGRCEVVLSAKQTGKKTTLKFNAVPQS
jgi:hypothetical protein